MPKLLPSALLALCVFVGATAIPAVAESGPTQATSPEAQAVKIYRSLRDQDWQAWFFLVAFSPKAKESLKDTTAEAFAADVWKGYNNSFKTPEDKKKTDDLFKSIGGIMVGEAVISGNTAAVPTSARITVNDKVLAVSGIAHLINVDGVWKLDLTFSDNTEQATSQRVGELIGTAAPDK